MCKISALEWFKKISVLAVLNLGFNNELLHIIFFFKKEFFIHQNNTTIQYDNFKIKNFTSI